MTQRQWTAALNRLEEMILSNAERESEVRAMARERYQRIFVKTYTVRAHFRPLKVRRKLTTFQTSRQHG